MSSNVIGWHVTMVIYVLRDSYSDEENVFVCIKPNLVLYEISEKKR